MRALGWLLAATLMVCVSPRTYAEDAKGATTDQELLESSIKLKEAAAAEISQDPLFSKERNAALRRDHLETAQAIEAASKPKLQESLDALIGGDEKVQEILAANAREEAASQPINAKYRLFVSRGQGQAAFKEILEIGRLHPDMVIVIRGLLPGEKMTDLAQFLGRLMQPKEGDAIPNIMLDPPSFTERGISVVPTLERLDPISGDVLASVKGVANPSWIEERVGRGERGALGTFGPTSEIAEEDMIVAMKRQAEQWDADAYGRKVVNKMYEQLDMVELPTATTTTVREVDPSVVITDGVTAPDGTVLAYPGQRINPFDIVPFDMTLVVIDARDADQVAFARRKVAELDGKPVTVVATELPREEGWKGFGDTITDIGRMVYLLQPEMVERFGIRAVPCTVEAGNRVLVVREYAREDYTKGMADAGLQSAKR